MNADRGERCGSLMAHSIRARPTPSGDTSGDVMRLAAWQLSREWRQRVQVLRERLAQGRAALDARGVVAARDSEGN